MHFHQSIAGSKVLLVALVLSFCAISTTKSEDIINVDTSGVAPQYRFAFDQAEAFWDKHLIGYSRLLPRFVRRQLGDINIVATTPFIDGAGGILGMAGPTRTVDFAGGVFDKFGTRRSISISQEGIMNFDVADLPGLQQSGDLVDVVMHEMAHALGFGSLWEQNDVIWADADDVTQYRYDGYAMQQYRQESGVTSASYVPIEQDGGGGTALSHWDDDDPFFNQTFTTGRAELMLGALMPAEQFVSGTTFGSFADLWFVVDGINNGDLGNDVFGGGRRRPKTWGGYPDWLNLRSGGITAVPEPGSLAMLAIAAVGIGVIRRRR